MEIKDYYKILEIERTASAGDIRKAYIRLARLYHPDTNGGDTGSLDKFMEVVEAYKILGNLDSRLKYSIELNKKIKLPKYFDEGIPANRKR